jgi:trehalose 6-phosphate synthase/phosphatase
MSNSQAKPQEGRLVVISNRLPVRLQQLADGWRAERSSGGLATAMNPILRRSGGLWIGWPGSSAGIGDPRRQEIIDRWAAQDHLISVELPAETAHHFYEGYANQTLWPLFHYFPSQITFDPNGWAAYREANERFRDAAVRHYRPGDEIWVHDYQLMLLPRLLREALPEARIGFFLHIPFPSSEVFRILPERADLLEGLLGADLLAFQTHSHLQHFRSTLLRVLGRESHIDQLEVGGRSVALEALPIGIAPEEFTDLLKRREAAAHLAELKQRFHGKQILLSVDRMDYTKGIPERLRTFRRLLEKAPGLRRRVVLIQVAVPSRERISSYEALRRQVNELVGEINGQFATPDWTPVVYIRRGISRAQLVALYSSADIGWVTPLRDGMNLVAKEYVACKQDSGGVLLLSEFAGAAEDMGEAVMVNPYDEERTAAALEAALNLSPEKRRPRMEALRQRVERNNVFAWAERFIALLRRAAASRAESPTDRPPPLNWDAIIAAYREAGRRLLLLDYDGSLVSYAARPELATPPDELRSILRALVDSRKNSVMIVSGRKRTDLAEWFGDVPGLWLAAEHGAMIRPAGSSEWRPLRPDLSREWMQRVLPVLEHFVERTPGSFIEQKEYSLVWHYRLAESKFAEWLAHELVAMLEDMLAETELRAMRGRKIVEVKPLWIQKGAVAAKFLADCGPADFEFAIGDDRTDEDSFQALRPESWTIRVGGGRSRARFSLPDPDSVRALLARFGETQN